MTEPIQTQKSISNGADLASRGARLGAALLDGVAALVIVGVPTLAARFLLSTPESRSTVIGVTFFVFGVGLFVYQAALLTKTG